MNIDMLQWQLSLSLLLNLSLLLFVITLIRLRKKTRGNSTAHDFKEILRRAHPQLTPRQVEMAEYILHGYSNQQIERAMCITDGAVRTGKSRLKMSLNLSRSESLIKHLISLYLSA